MPRFWLTGSLNETVLWKALHRSYQYVGVLSVNEFQILRVEASKNIVPVGCRNMNVQALAHR